MDPQYSANSRTVSTRGPILDLGCAGIIILIFCAAERHSTWLDEEASRLIRMAFTCSLTDSRQGKNTQLPPADVLRQSVYTAVWPGARTSMTPNAFPRSDPPDEMR